MNAGTPIVWRMAKGEGGELGPDDSGKLGKLIDIAYHALDTLQFVTQDSMTAVNGSVINNIVKERDDPAGAAATFGGSAGSAGKVEVGGDTPYHGDDVLSANVTLGSKYNGDIKVTQTNAGQMNMLKLRIYGSKGSIEFNSDDANTLKLYDFDGTHKVISRNPGNLTYVNQLADWYTDGMAMLTERNAEDAEEAPGVKHVTAPFRYNTPPKHDQGWRDVHRKQAQAFALYAQLVQQGQLKEENRGDLYMVPTAAESLNVMQGLKAIYMKHAQQKEQVMAVQR